MFDKRLFEEVSSKISETIANSPARGIGKDVKAMLGNMLSRMGLVAQEEFDIQQQALVKTYTKLTELEARLAELEATQEPEEATLKAIEEAAEKVVAKIVQRTEAVE